MADATSNSDIVVEAPIAFPSQSPIMVEVASHSISIVGRSAVDGGRVTLDGLEHSRHFYVIGGTLHLSNLNLANGASLQVRHS